MLRVRLNKASCSHLVLWSAYVWFSYKCATIFVASSYAFSAQQAYLHTNYELADYYISKALAFRPNQPQYLIQQGFIAIKLKHTETVQQAISTSLKHSSTSYILQRDIMPLLVEGVRHNMLPASFAQNYFTTLQTTYPTDLGVQVQVAEGQKALNFETDHTKTLTLIKNLRPDILEWNTTL